MLKSAFVFPGQGSQSVGMLSDFLPQYPTVYQVFAEASFEVLGEDGHDGPVVVEKAETSEP